MYWWCSLLSHIPSVFNVYCCYYSLVCFHTLLSILIQMRNTPLEHQNHALSYNWDVKNRVTAADLSILIFQFTNHATTHYIWLRVIIAYFSLEQNHGIGFVTRVTPVVYPLAVSHLHVCFQWVPLDLDLHHSIDANSASLPSFCVWIHLTVHL